MSDQDQVRLRDVLGLSVVPDYDDAGVLPTEPGWYWIEGYTPHDVVRLIEAVLTEKKTIDSLWIGNTRLEDIPGIKDCRFAGPIPKPSNAR